MQSSLEMRLDMLEGMLEQANVERRKAEAEQEKFDRCISKIYVRLAVMESFGCKFRHVGIVLYNLFI